MAPARAGAMPDPRPALFHMNMTIDKLRAMALAVLPRMFRPEEDVHVHCLRRVDGAIRPEGVSQRYTAMTLIGLATEAAHDARAALAGKAPVDVGEALIRRVDGWTNLGDTAVTLWAARLLGCADTDRALRRLRTLDPVNKPHPTVELAWTVAALTVGHDPSPDPSLAHATASRLLDSYHADARLFPHQPHDAPAPALRGHVGCFADQVYPIQALAFYGMKFSDKRAIDASQGCARKICELMGRDGQWWWHYDVRSGRVVEGYPVYSVHQDAMAPMALLAAQAACGENFDEAIDLGLKWLVHSPEIGASLIDTENNIIWRKVCRREPGKLTRAMQAVASSIHPAIRVPGTRAAFPPVAVDWESRPYHMGWLLHAFPASLSKRFLRQPSETIHDPARRVLAKPASV